MNHAVEEDPEENVSEKAANKRVSDGQPAVQEIRLPFEVRLEHPEQRLQQHRHEVEDESGHTSSPLFLLPDNDLTDFVLEDIVKIQTPLAPSNLLDFSSDYA
ncbi:hypothetical protein WR25_19919 [Diploscapter pachys]|uniref:Uncharacterized protein n=1 Tax=Diploscapter pachys TaxID=2018661 RepID=A0A2A2LXM4_9BILA|nr:hypothetical protein WR25_19919 [Diploscapter pachys]